MKIRIAKQPSGSAAPVEQDWHVEIWCWYLPFWRPVKCYRTLECARHYAESYKHRTIIPIR